MSMRSINKLPVTSPRPVTRCVTRAQSPGQLSSLTFPNQPWPIVEKFLKELPAGSVGLDVGCGNGKNLMVNKDVFIVASDRYVLYTMGKDHGAQCYEFL